MKDKWELARYVIDCKKCIDSIMYINDNFSKISNLFLKEIIDEKLRHFYINICIVYDKSFSKINLKELKTNDIIVNCVYKERDKNYAHKDSDYIIITNKKMSDLISRLKEQLNHCFELCSTALPHELTLDYVSYDRNLFRFAYSITPEIENRLNNKMYLLSGVNNDVSHSYKVFDDTEDIKLVTEKDEYGVVLDNGLTIEEGLQNRQDAMIKLNVLHGTNAWCTISHNMLIKSKEYKDYIIDTINSIRK